MGGASTAVSNAEPTGAMAASSTTPRCRRTTAASQSAIRMARSAAYDHDLTYERRDLERFFGLYRDGPNGIFLKRGKQLRIDVGASPPFVHLRKKPDLRSDRLYFAKSLIYPVVAAPFVRLF